MRQFKSFEDYSDFERAVKKGYRYIRTKEEQDFLETVFETAKKRVKTVLVGKLFWRAQLGHGMQPVYYGNEHVGDEPGPFPKERMKPLKESATEGRANPKGIPCLYVATKKEIAIAEVRPWMDSFVSVAGLKTLRSLRIVDCTMHQSESWISCGSSSVEEIEEYIWWYIDNAFKKPVNKSDNIDDYAPTQIIAELFKVNGLDGLAYRSVFDDPEKQRGYNLTFFDLEALDVVDIRLLRVKSVKYVTERGS